MAAIASRGFGSSTPEQIAAFHELEMFNAIELESFATVNRFDSAWGLLRNLHEHPLNEHSWAFRGHADTGWKLEPSIERLARKYMSSFRLDAEDYVREAFKRRAHHYLKYVPEEADELEWMALMRHHGAPTRLLDWTRSPYVAAFL